MVDMGVARNQVVDILGVDAGGFEVIDEEAHVFGTLDRIHAGLEQRELVAGVDDQWREKGPASCGTQTPGTLRYGRSTGNVQSPSHSLPSCSGPAAAKPVFVKSVLANLPECDPDMRPAATRADSGQLFRRGSNGSAGALLRREVKLR